MTRRSRSALTWVAVGLLTMLALLYFSESAMTWLRVTLHGR